MSVAERLEQLSKLVVVKNLPDQEANDMLAELVVTLFNKDLLSFNDGARVLNLTDIAFLELLDKHRADVPNDLRSIIRDVQNLKELGLLPANS